MSIFLRDPGDDAGTSPADPTLAATTGLDTASLFPQTAWMRPPRSGMFGNIRRAAQQCVGPRFSQFFAQNYLPVAAIAAKRGTDVAQPLGVAAFEDGYGDSPMYRLHHNPFGATPDGTDGVDYNSLASAWDNWDRQWGPRIQGTGDDTALFEKDLLKDNRHVSGAVDQRGPYNTLKPGKTNGNPKWPSGVAGTIAGVRKRLPIWLESGC